MHVSDWIAAIAAVVAALLAAVALAVALRAKEIAETANGIADTGNTLARTANGTASEALTEAERANSFAAQANELSVEANAIAERALRAALDDVPYNWVLKVSDDGVAEVHNDCGHSARLVRITLDCDGTVVVESEAIDFSPFAKITLDAKIAVGKHLDKVRKNPAVPASVGGSVFLAGRNGKSVSTTFRAHVTWQTEQGLPRTAVVSEVLRHQMSMKGLRRMKNQSA